jgi:serine/threonine protein kinase
VIKCKPNYTEEISEEAINLLKGILEKDPVKRLTIYQIRKHSWMKKHYTKKQVTIFTEHEKTKIDSEFQYYNARKENNNPSN